MTGEITSLRKLQLAELDILKKVLHICGENNLTYYISGGTYLGAVRHEGFIPWDDDIDIAMPRPDYEKFLKVAPSFLDSKFDLITYGNCENYYFYHSRVVNREIKVINRTAKLERIEPAWIDLFPLDGMPDNWIISKIHQAYLLCRRALLKLSCFDENVNLHQEGRPFIEKLLIWIGLNTRIGGCIDTKKQLDEIDESLKKYPSERSESYVNFMGSYKFKSIISKKIYGKGAKYKFEGLLLNGPENYDAYLKQIYGDYMTMPPREKQNKHNTEVIESGNRNGKI